MAADVTLRDTRIDLTKSPAFAADLAGLDALETFQDPRRPLPARIWSSAWPKLAAVGLGLLIWQIAVWSAWRPEWVLPSPLTVFESLGNMITTAEFWDALANTLRRAVLGFGFALVSGTAIGLAVARVRVLRTAVGSLITGLQTMPSVAWFPLAILFFGLNESAIFFVVVLGAAPSIANGLINGVDYVPPLLVRAGRVLGARGWSLYRHVIMPAALPSYLAGLKQGWAFAWRSLMAGELLVIIANRHALGQEMQFARDNSDAVKLISIMIVILVIGIFVDVLFNAFDKRLRARRGILDSV